MDSVHQYLNEKYPSSSEQPTQLDRCNRKKRLNLTMKIRHENLTQGNINQFGLLRSTRQLAQDKLGKRYSQVREI